VTTSVATPSPIATSARRILAWSLIRAGWFRQAARSEVGGGVAAAELLHKIVAGPRDA
jgi:hypothetical protein